MRYWLLILLLLAGCSGPPYEAKVLAIEHPSNMYDCYRQCVLEREDGEIVELLISKAMGSAVKPGDWVKVKGSKIYKVNQP